MSIPSVPTIGLGCAFTGYRGDNKRREGILHSVSARNATITLKTGGVKANGSEEFKAYNVAYIGQFHAS